MKQHTLADKEVNENKPILDACCGMRAIWFDKHNKDTLYIDIREEEKGFIPWRSNREVKPDMLADYRSLPFKDKQFKLIVWDPPHIKSKGMSCRMTKSYGALNPETWQNDLQKGFKELWRCLDIYGTLVFKFNDFNIKFENVLKLFPVKPLLGTTTSVRKNSETRWFVYFKSSD